MLWAELQPNFPDMSTFIPSICGTVTAWCNALSTLLDDDKNSEWTEQVLEELSKTNALKIRLEAHNMYISTSLCMRADDSSRSVAKTGQQPAGHLTRRPSPSSSPKPGPHPHPPWWAALAAICCPVSSQKQPNLPHQLPDPPSLMTRGPISKLTARAAR